MLPATISTVLNQHFGEMTRIVFKHGGTVDKLIGDVVMAFWNAPASRKEHAADAVRAAVDMIAALRELNETWQAERTLERHQTIEIRIGINTGKAVVGNLGSRDRLSYTAIGQTVNIAARLEGLNKDLDSTILLGKETYEDALLTVRLEGSLRDGVRLKGVAAAQTIFVLQGIVSKIGGPGLGLPS